jgi:hypothetical protein
MAVMVDDDPESSNNQPGIFGIEIEATTKVSVVGFEASSTAMGVPIDRRTVAVRTVVRPVTDRS